jgi:hypothetical protein
MIGWMLDQAMKWLLKPVQTALNLLWSLMVATLFHLPDVTGLHPVQVLAARSLLVVNISYSLVIVAVGIALMLPSGPKVVRDSGDLVPGLVVGLVAANLATPVCRAIITTANALVAALTGEGIASQGVLGRIVSMAMDALTNQIDGLLGAFIGVILVALIVILMAGWISRFTVLVVVCGIAPLALACHATPWSDPIARLWWRTLGGVCLIVILQALVLNTSLSIFLAPGDGLTAYGFPAHLAKDSQTLTLFIVAILLWTTARIPALVRRYLAQGGGQNIVGALIRLVIAQQVTRRLGTTLRTVTGASAARGAHRTAGVRHAAGRATGDPLRGFSPPATRERVGTHRDDRARHATERAVAEDPLRPFLPPAPPRARAGAHREDLPRHAVQDPDDPLQEFLPPPNVRSRRDGPGQPRPRRRPPPDGRPR